MLFECKTKNPAIQKQLDKAMRVKSLARPPVCLPNIHAKKCLESPPQFAAATKNTIVPMLSAPSMNCGMSIFKTNLTKDDFSEEFLNNFAVLLRKEIAPRLSRIKTVLLWFGLYKRARQKYDLSKNELEQVFLKGAEAAVKIYNLPEKELNSMEYQGNVVNTQDHNKFPFSSIIPRSSYTNGRHEIGYNFGGNHFLEIHFVENIENENIAQKWGLKKNQLLLFYHGGGGHAAYHLGRYFGHREKNTKFEKIALFFLKAAFHFGSAEGLKNFGARWNAYFKSAGRFPEIPADSHEGRRLMQSIKFALNYGYAFRAALLRRIKDALPDNTEVSLLWDAAHNSIAEEEINGSAVIMHRQDATRVFKDKPVMISGLSNTLSYIGIGSESAYKTMRSASQSAAKTIERFAKDGKTRKEEPARVTLISKRKYPAPERKEHITSDGLFKVVHELEKEDIIKPVAYIRPLAVIKGH